MKIKAGEVEETVKNIMNRYLTGGEIDLKNYKFLKKQ